MLFNSPEFLLFLPIVFAAYWILNKWIDRGPGVLRAQNLLLLVSSYVFYGWWRPDFVLLMLTSTVVDYMCGKAIVRNRAASKPTKRFMVLACIVNLGLLAYFKYANFGIDTINAILAAMRTHGMIAT